MPSKPRAIPGDVGQGIVLGARFGDFCLAAVILVLAIASLCATANRLPARAAKALVYCDRTPCQEIDLAADGVYGGGAGNPLIPNLTSVRAAVMTEMHGGVADNHGIPNLPEVGIEVRGGRLRIAQTDCPRQLCKHSGWISRPGQTIVCLPNRLLIEITGPGDVPTCDAISY